MRLPHALRNRWVAVPLALTAVLLAWNLYVARNDGGVVEGRVVDVAGPPVPDATVILLQRRFVTHNERQRTTTHAAGRFHFGGNDNHSLQLEAEAAGLGRSERLVVRLWFRAQNVVLTEPVRFAGQLP